MHFTVQHQGCNFESHAIILLIMLRLQRLRHQIMSALIHRGAQAWIFAPGITLHSAFASCFALPRCADEPNPAFCLWRKPSFGPWNRCFSFRLNFWLSRCPPHADREDPGHYTLLLERLLEEPGQPPHHPGPRKQCIQKLSRRQANHQPVSEPQFPITSRNSSPHWF